MEYKTVEYYGLTKEVVERNATTEEVAEVEKLCAKLEARNAAKLQKATAKAALLDRLGITEDEAKLLLS